MKKRLLYLICLSLVTTALFAQKKYKRIDFHYERMRAKAEIACSDDLKNTLNRAMELLEVNQSATALRMIEEARKTHGLCSISEFAYAEALFRNGQWLKSNEVIDAAIRRYGPLPPLVRIRSQLCIEMAEYGIGMQAIDGNMVYLPKSKQLPFEENQFKHANLLYAVSALEFLRATEPDEAGEELTFLLGSIYQALEDYPKSNAAFESLLSNSKFQNRAMSQIIKNLITLKDYGTAEQKLLAMSARIPRNFQIYQNMEGLYSKMGEKDKAMECKRKAHFYYLLPSYTNLNYSSENLNALLYFEEDHSTEEKHDALEAIGKRPLEEAIDLYIGILNMHANHGNGIEDEATTLLGQAGQPAVDELIGVLQNPTTTCTMSNAGFALAKIKDQRGWDALVEALPIIDRIGFTTTLPSLPQCLVDFDKARALQVLLPWIKQRMDRPQPTDEGNPLGSLGDIFANGVIYRPLQVYDQAELRSKAKELGFSETQILELVDKVYDKLETQEEDGK